MAFTWHGQDRELIWENVIIRYYFVSEQVVETYMPYGSFRPSLNVGTRFKITKSEAAKFFRKGYYEYNTSTWNPDNNGWDRITVCVKGRLEKEVESRFCRKTPVSGEEFSRKKK